MQPGKKAHKRTNSDFAVNRMKTFQDISAPMNTEPDHDAKDEDFEAIAQYQKLNIKRRNSFDGTNMTSTKAKKPNFILALMGDKVDSMDNDSEYTMSDDSMEENTTNDDMNNQKASQESSQANS